jgi:hypothetical protein
MPESPMRNWLDSGISARRNGVILVPEVMAWFLQEGRLSADLDVASIPTTVIF